MLSEERENGENSEEENEEEHSMEEGLENRPILFSNFREAFEEDEQEELENSGPEDNPQEIHEEEKIPQPPNKQKKKRKKKKTKGEEKGEEAEIAKIFEEMNIKVPTYEESKELAMESLGCLRMETINLNAQKEFSRLFMGLVEEKKEESALSQQNLSKKARKKLDRFIKMTNKKQTTDKQKRMLLAQREPSLPPIPKIIKMDIADYKAGTQIFTFLKTPEYIVIENEFHSIQRTHDINQVIQFTQKYFYFPEALLALAEYLKLQNDYTQATTLIERLICVFESSWDSRFQVVAPKPNVSIDMNQDNELNMYFDQMCINIFRLFGEGIFRYIEMLGKKGCNRTALEYTKLLLALNPQSDIYGCLLFIDFYILRARQYSFFEELMSEFMREMYGEKGYSLLLLPNLLFSLAISKRNCLPSPPPFPTHSELLAQYQLLENIPTLENESKSLSWECLIMLCTLMYPSLIIRIVENSGALKGRQVKLGVFEGEQLVDWTTLFKNKDLFPKHSFIGYDWVKAQSEDLNAINDILNKIFDIYVEKGANCVNGDELNIWLKGIVGFLGNIIKEGKLKPQAFRKKIIANNLLPFTLERYKMLRVVDFKEDVSTLPPEELNPIRQNALFAGNPVPVNPVPMGDGTANPLMLFLRSLIPWDPVNRPNQDHE